MFSGPALSLLLLLVPGSAMAASSRRIGTKPSLPAGATAAGALPQTTQLNVTVTLQPRDPAALAAYATAVSTPGSSVYHQYLSVGQFSQRFGPTPSAIAAAQASMRAQGLAPGPLAPNGLSFQVSSDAGRMSSAFNTHFERYHLRSGRTAFANTSAPQVTGSGASVVQSVIGLDNLAVERPQALVRPKRNALSSGLSLPRATASSAVTACSSAVGAGGYTADQIASAYGFNGLYNASPNNLGSGVTVALYELEPYASKDITAYQNCYGTPTNTVSDVLVDGGASCGSGVSKDPSCGLEDELDIEDVIGLAPDASIHVYQGPNTNRGAFDTYNQIVTDDTAKVISTSWGECESELGSSAASAENTLFQEAAAQGQSVFAAAGDGGSQDGCADSAGNPTSTPAVDDPASQPYVTGVGGTSLASTVGPVESVWNDGTQGGAGGGGVSTLWAAQPYQSGFARGQSSISCGSGGTACREVPDVSADADPNTGYDIYWKPTSSTGAKGWPANYWGVLGGTSAAAPTWASLVALADASSACSSAPVGFANPGLYAAARTSYGSNFNDITSGDNSIGGVAGYSAGRGYDMASGLGSPIGTTLASTLCGEAGDSVGFSGTPAGQISTVGRSVVPVTVRAVSKKGLGITYTAAGLPPGLSITSSGEISGTPAAPGASTVVVKAEDTDGMVSTLSFRWTVVGLPRISASRLHISGTRGSLSLTLRAGQYAPGLKKLELIVPRGAHLAGRRTLGRRVNLFTLGGRRQTISRRLSRGKLFVTLKSALSGAQLRLTGSELTFTRALASGLSRRTRTAKLTLLVTDAAGALTRLTLTLR